MTPIDRMHREYGYGSGKCAACCNLIRGNYHDKRYNKCVAFGASHSLATDWRLKWDACGLFGKPFEELRPARRPLIEVGQKYLASHEEEDEPDIPLAGQMSLEDL